MMRDINILINGEILTLSINTDIIKRVGFNKEILQSEDDIINISVTGNIVIIVTEDPDFRNGLSQVDFVKPYKIKKNNINAYDWAEENGCRIINMSLGGYTQDIENGINQDYLEAQV